MKNDPHFGLACHFLSGTLPLAGSGAGPTCEGTSPAAKKLLYGKNCIFNRSIFIVSENKGMSSSSDPNNGLNVKSRGLR